MPILLLVFGAASVVLDQMAWRDFRKRKFSTFEEKQKFRMMLFWGPWGSYRYLRLVRKKTTSLPLYVKTLSAIGLLLLIWVGGQNAPMGPRLVITALALTTLCEAYVAWKSRHLQ